MNSHALKQAASEVRERLPDTHPAMALILGSGWGGAVDGMNILHEIPYAEIPMLGPAGVRGHRGRLLLGELQATRLLVFQGRRHWYEGAGWEPVALPVYVCIALGIESLILTNAAGGISPDLEPGMFMLIEDHINAMGVSPLLGPHDTDLGARFPDQTEVYGARLRRRLDAAARHIGENLVHGVYLATSGPAYETPAEIRAYSVLGADAVGMSTVPEAMLAHAAGIEVAGISCITNRAAAIAEQPLSHDEVVAVTHSCIPRMRALLDALTGSSG